MQTNDAVFGIAEECRALGIIVGTVLFRGVTIGDSPPALRAAAQSVAEEVRQRFSNIAALRASRELAAFRDVYGALSVSVQGVRGACQRLAEFAWKRQNLPAINSFVETYC